jgi:hypothetical protein
VRLLPASADCGSSRDDQRLCFVAYPSGARAKRLYGLRELAPALTQPQPTAIHRRRRRRAVTSLDPWAGAPRAVAFSLERAILADGAPA